MPQSSIAYAVARIRVLEGRLITQDKLERMIDAGNAPDAMKLLAETDLGEYLPALSSPLAYDELLRKDIEYSCQLLNELTTEPLWSDCFLFPFDVQNLKLLIKLHALDTAETAPLVHAGTIPLEKLRAAVQQGETHALPAPLRAATDAALEQSPLQPQQMEFALDRALYKMILDNLRQRPNAFLLDYFQNKIDVINIVTMVRLRTLSVSMDAFDEAFIPGGRLSCAFFHEHEDMDALSNALYSKPYGPSVAKGIEDWHKTGRVSSLERAAEDYYLSAMRVRRQETFSIEPVLGFFLAKLTQAQAVRMVLMGLINGMPAQDIGERLRDLYV